MTAALKGHGGAWGIEESVVARLVTKGWELGRARNTVRRALERGHPFAVGRFGNVMFCGTDASIYDNVAHVLDTYWGQRQRLRHCLALDTHRAVGPKGKGDWVFPDVVLLADPPRRQSGDEPRRIHAIEVEQRHGFSIQSVYQAYEQGRGSDYSWVYFVRDPQGDMSMPRVLVAAKELGVGLVSMDKPHVVGTWREILPATKRAVNPRERDSLRSTLHITDAMLEDHASR